MRFWRILYLFNCRFHTGFCDISTQKHDDVILSLIWCYFHSLDIADTVVFLVFSATETKKTAHATYKVGCARDAYMCADL